MISPSQGSLPDNTQDSNKHPCPRRDSKSISRGERPKAYNLDRAATRTSQKTNSENIQYSKSVTRSTKPNDEETLVNCKTNPYGTEFPLSNKHNQIYWLIRSVKHSLICGHVHWFNDYLMLSYQLQSLFVTPLYDYRPVNEAIDRVSEPRFISHSVLQ